MTFRLSFAVGFSVLALTTTVSGLTTDAQTAGWHAVSEHDPLHGVSRTKLVLAGTYITPPRHGQYGGEPKLVMICRDGKVDQNRNYLEVDAVLNPEHYLEARIDGGKMKRIAWHESTDFSGAFFDTFEMVSLLKGHEVILGVHEFLGSEIVMKFTMPDPGPVLESCGQDQWLRKFKR